MFNVFRYNGYKPVASFKTRKEAVYWCKINQISSLPDGEWTDDYYIEATDESD